MADQRSIFDEPEIPELPRELSLASLYEIRDRLSTLPREPSLDGAQPRAACSRCHRIVDEARIHADAPYCDWCIRVVTADATTTASTETSDVARTTRPPASEQEGGTDMGYAVIGDLIADLDRTEDQRVPESLGAPPPVAHVLTILGRGRDKHGLCSCGWKSPYEPTSDAVAGHHRTHVRNETTTQEV